MAPKFGNRTRQQKTAGHAMGRYCQIVLRIDEETRDQVNDLAEEANVSFAEQCRILIEFGLIAIEEDRDAA